MPSVSPFYLRLEGVRTESEVVVKLVKGMRTGKLSELGGRSCGKGLVIIEAGKICLGGERGEVFKKKRESGSRRAKD